MKTKRRRRCKKKKYDLFLISKITLICYLAIFGVGYLTSDTSAYYTSQSEVSQTITAGIWEITDSSCVEQLNKDGEDEVGTSTEESSNDGISDGANETDCVDTEDSSKKTDEKEIVGEIACKGEDNNSVAPNKKDKKDCKGIDEPKEEKEIDKDTENVETIEPKDEATNELEEGNSDAEKESENKTTQNDQPNSTDEIQKQPDSIDEPNNDSQEKNAVKDEAPVNEENSKSEGDTNEIQ
ncbi:TasA anchoring/assembly protein [Psychrobacillus sp. OK028]|uniref:SipW-dependent-type signal peptide-containing protein n=1 Tax=Psychrobacillus sp. OK028 TaxID=1884359 RepID=UPI0008904065|nr:SipW-dependent-type signal peptide-containing protein [Psychrobacillus sp. OK028]SDM37962.1 TasA anchoring/assembly protein [Psychrobacillus sp. OK028]